MDKLSVVKRIIHSIIPNVRVVLKDGLSSHISYGIEINILGKVTKVDKINKFVISNVSCGDEIINTITPEWIPTAKKYHDVLFSILHEVGHYYTIVGTNYNIHSQSLIKIKETYYDNHRANVAYHQLNTEKLADEWAIKWLEKYPGRAEFFSNLLNRVY